MVDVKVSYPVRLWRRRKSCSQYRRCDCVRYPGTHRITSATVDTSKCDCALDPGPGRTGRLVDWEAARANCEGAGFSQGAVARKHGRTRCAVQKHIEAEGWQQDVTKVVDRAVAAKVGRVVAGSDPLKE